MRSLWERKVVSSILTSPTTRPSGVNGNTTVSKTVVLGSSPSCDAKHKKVTMKQTLNAQINSMYFTSKDEVLVLVLDLVKVGMISFPLHKYEDIVKLTNIFPEGYHKEKYLRLLIEDNKVLGIGHITEDLIFMIPVEELVAEPVEE